MPPHQILCLWTNSPVNTRSRAGPSLAQLWPPGRPWGRRWPAPAQGSVCPRGVPRARGKGSSPRWHGCRGLGREPGQASHAQPQEVTAPAPVTLGASCFALSGGDLDTQAQPPGQAWSWAHVRGASALREWLCEQLRGDREPHEGGPGPRCPDPPPSTLSPALMTVNCESQACAVTPWTPGIWGRAGVMGHQELPSSYRGLGRDGPVPRAAEAREGRL